MTITSAIALVCDRTQPISKEVLPNPRMTVLKVRVSGNPIAVDALCRFLTNDEAVISKRALSERE